MLRVSAYLRLCVVIVELRRYGFFSSGPRERHIMVWSIINKFSDEPLSQAPKVNKTRSVGLHLLVHNPLFVSCLFTLSHVSESPRCPLCEFGTALEGIFSNLETTNEFCAGGYKCSERCTPFKGATFNDIQVN